MGKRIALAADIHLGIQNRLVDLIWALTTMALYAVDHKIDVIIILGDLFHDRRNLSIDVLCTAYEFFESTKKVYGLEWIVFPGNHDMFLKHSWAVNSLKPLAQLMTVITDVKVIKIEDQRFWILPFIHNEAAYMDVLAKIEERYEDGDILLTHIGVRGSELNVCFLLKDWSFVHFTESKFERIYTGHFHIPQQAGANVWYPGSIIPFKFDEGNSSHGFLVYDLASKEHQAVDIWEAGRRYLPDESPPPNFLTFPDRDLDKLTPELIQHNFLRIAPNRDYTDNERSEIRQELIAAGAKAVRWMELKRDDRKLSQATKTGGVAVQDAFDILLKADSDIIKKQGLLPNLLKQINGDVVKEGDEQYSSNLGED